MGLDKSASMSRFQGWVIPVLLLAVAVVIAAGGDDWRLATRFDRIWLTEGESWRLVTGHLAHLGWSHLALNAAGLLLVWFLVGARLSASGWLVVIGTTITAINIGLWILNPALLWYVGLSGLLHGLLVAGLVVKLPDVNAETLVLSGLIVAKLIWEQIAGPVPGSESGSGGAVIVDAHLYGAAGGLLGAALSRIRLLRGASL